MENTLKSLVGDLVPLTEKPAVVDTQKVVKPVETSTNEKAIKSNPETKNDIPHAIAMTWKHGEKEARDDNASLRQDNAELRRQYMALAPGASAQVAEQPVAPEAKQDPLQVHIAEYKKLYVEENGHEPNLSDIPVPANVYLERDAWQKDNAQQQQQQQEESVRANSISIAETRTMTDAEFGPGLGLTAMVARGAKYLTKWDRAEISEAGENCPVIMYRKCMERTIQSGTPEGVELARQVQEKLHPTVTPESLTKKDEIQVETPVETQAPSAEEAIGRHPHLARLRLGGFGKSA